MMNHAISLLQEASRNITVAAECMHQALDLPLATAMANELTVVHCTAVILATEVKVMIDKLQAARETSEG